jgi:ubiquinone/menaquinone biosynthesis C-methylase UbiE
LNPSATAQPQAVLAFNTMAKDYDDHFTRSLIGRSQRNAVWKTLTQTFHSGDHILELNCGTGEDALFLSRNGISVTACDASNRMIEVARRRRATEAPFAPIQFYPLPTERLVELRSEAQFDGAFSNFSGLNCVQDLQRTAKDLASLVKPGAPLLLCMSTRFCISEVLWFLLHGNLKKALRRCSGETTAKVGEFAIDVYYPTVREIKQVFSPYFVLRSCTGIGITVPPSYVESSICRFPKALLTLQAVDKVISKLPWLRVIGDHMLLHFERMQP